MKRKTLVKVMVALLVILLIVLGIMIGGKKMNSDDTKNPDTETEVEEQEEGKKSRNSLIKPDQS